MAAAMYAEIPENDNFAICRADLPPQKVKDFFCRNSKATRSANAVLEYPVGRIFSVRPYSV